MPSQVPEGSGDGRAPTQLMQSYLNMGHDNRRFMRRLGLACWAFTGLLVSGAFLVRTFTDNSLSLLMWAFTFLVFFAGFLLIWPQAGVHLIERAPDAIAKLMPRGLGSRPDRRSEDR